MFYLFHGSNRHEQREKLEGLLDKMGDREMLSLNTTRFDSRVSLTELQQACSAVPFLANVRVVLVDGLFSSSPDKGMVDKLLDYLPELPDTARLFFLEPKGLPENSRIVKLARSAGNGYELKVDLPEGAQLARWVQKTAADQGGEMTPQAANLLAANIASSGDRQMKENQMEILDNEIAKLVLYKDGEGAIDVDDVLLLSPYAAEASIFDLVDALGGRQAARAAELLQKKLNEGADPFYLFAMFVRQFRLLIQVREMLDQGERPPAIAAQLRVPGFVASKLAQQAQGFSMAQLEQIYERLLEIDVEVKTGQADMLTALSLLLAGLTVEI